MPENPVIARATTEPEVTMSAVKLDRDGNVVETIEMHNVEANLTPGFLEQLKQAAREGWQEGQDTNRKDAS